MFCKLNQEDVLFQNKWPFVLTQIYVSFSVSLGSGKCVYVVVYWRERERRRRWVLLASRAALEKKPQLHSQGPGDTLAIC